MRLDDLIIAWFCVMDDLMPSLTKGQRLRQRGPHPKLADSEVLTIAVVGTYLGLIQDTEVFTYFRRHWTAFFPALAQYDLCAPSGESVGHQRTMVGANP